MPATAKSLPGTSRIVFTIVAPFGLGYYISYFYRAVNAIIAPDLVTEFGLSAGDLGFLTSAYFFTFAVFQIPLGILLDRYGPRRVQTVLLTIAGLGGALFAFGQSFTVLTLARALIGLGVSGCLMASLKANVLWWPKERLPLVNGVIVAFGTMGAMSATVPVEIVAEMFGWRAIFLALAAASVAVALLITFMVPERPEDVGARLPSLAAQFCEMRIFCFDPGLWRVAVIAFVHSAVFVSYQTLWAGPWLRDVAGMDGRAIAENILLINFGMFMGALLIGGAVERAQRWGIQPIAGLGICVAASIVVHLFFAFEAVTIATPLCFAFGFFGSSSLLVYAVFGQRYPASMIGRVNTAQNTLVFVFAFLVQWGTGLVINRWPQTAQGGYDPAAHQAALFTLVAAEIAALVWLVWPRRSAGKEAGIEG